MIGFAFLVPDVKYNEAYISFIFTHPEWRGAGIGTFVLYHLIQVGKNAEKETILPLAKLRYSVDFAMLAPLHILSNELICPSPGCE